MKVIKRDGRTVEYDRNKILIAIRKANAEVEPFEKISDEKIDGIIAGIENMKRETLQVEDIQDIIEQKLMAAGKFILAKKYIIYRYTRELVRKANTTDDSIMSLIQNSNKDVMEENSNKNAFSCRRRSPGPMRRECCTSTTWTTLSSPYSIAVLSI